MARDLARADLTLRPFEYLIVRVLTVVGMIFLFWLLGQTLLPILGNPLLLIAGALLGFVLPGIYIRRRQQQRLNAFDSRLADTITLLANALRSGSSFLQATELIVRETNPPISTEFGRVIREVQLGLTTEQALANIVRRVKSADLELMATAITIQYQVGGNLAEILDIDRLHDPGTRSNQGRDTRADCSTAPVRLRGRPAADSPGCRQSASWHRSS